MELGAIAERLSTTLLNAFEKAWPLPLKARNKNSPYGTGRGVKLACLLHLKGEREVIYPTDVTS